MRTAAIIRRLGIEKGEGISLGIGRGRVSWFSSHFSVCCPSFRSLATTSTSTRHWRCFHGRGFPVANLVQSSSIKTSGFFGRESLDALRSTTRFTAKISRRYLSSNGLQDKKRGAKGDENSEKEKASVIAINKTIIELGKAGKWEEILSLYQEQKEYFNAVNHSTMMTQFGRIQHTQKDDPLFRDYLDDLSTMLDDRGIAWLGKDPRQLANIVHAIAKMKLEGNSSVMNIMRFMEDGKTTKWLFENGTPQNVANCIWACGSLRLESPNLFRLLDQRSKWLFQHGDSQNIANCVWACGTLGISSPNLFRLLDQRSKLLFENGNQQEITNCVWACGTLGIQSPKLFQLLDQRSEWLFEKRNPKDIANCVWACGTLGIKSPNLFQLLDQRSKWLFENGNTQDIANCVWACGTLGVESPKLFELLDHHSEWLFENGTPQAITNCVSACATLGIRSPNIFQLLDQRSKWLFENGTPQGIANCVWACGTLGIESPNLFRMLDQRSEWLFDNGTPQSIANCAWACASLRIKSPKLFQSFDHYAEWLVAKGNSQDISNCALALSLLGIESPTFFSALEARLDKYLVDSTTQGVCNVCYAICVLDVNVSSKSVLLVNLWANLLERTTGDLPVEALRQIRYVEACASVYELALASPPSDLTTQLDQVTYDDRSSRFQNKVSSILLRIGFSHQCDVSPLESFPGLLSIDIACPDRMIAIECDGPSHYLSTVDGAEKNRENGPTKAKRRLLQELGWNVINLSWMESRQHRVSKEWIRVKLCEAGVEC